VATTVQVFAEAFKQAGRRSLAGTPGGASVELMETARQRQMRFLPMQQDWPLPRFKRKD
jgi:acetolactate synthase-1/2/3 large subunit